MRQVHGSATAHTYSGVGARFRRMCRILVGDLTRLSAASYLRRCLLLRRLGGLGDSCWVESFLRLSAPPFPRPSSSSEEPGLV